MKCVGWLCGGVCCVFHALNKALAKPGQAELGAVNEKRAPGPRVGEVSRGQIRQAPRPHKGFLFTL